MGKCPVCDGSGVVPAGFYPGVSPSSGLQTCRTCGGRQVVSEAAVSAPMLRDPTDLTYDGPDR